MLAACSCNQKERPSANAGSMQEIMVLENDSSNDSDTPIISAAALVTTDDTGNIYLVDYRTMKIHSYSDDGSHLWSAGGQGSGPGLFNIVSAIHVSGKTLYVYDGSNAKMTRYSLDGEQLGESTFGESGHQLNLIRRMPDGSFIAAGRNEKSGAMVHMYSEDLENRITQFLNGDDILDTESPNLEKQVLRNYSGSVMPIDSSTILYAAPAYDGKLLRFQRQSEPNEWEQIENVKGYTSIEKPLSFQRSQDGNNKRSHLSGFHPDGGYFSTEFTSMSRGLYKLQDGRIAHLSLRLNENDNWDLIVEYFNPDDLNLENHTIVKGALNSQQLEKIPVWMDKKGQIYITQRSDTPLRVIDIKKGI